MCYWLCDQKMSLIYMISTFLNNYIISVLKMTTSTCMEVRQLHHILWLLITISLVIMTTGEFLLYILSDVKTKKQKHKNHLLFASACNILNSLVFSLHFSLIIFKKVHSSISIQSPLFRGLKETNTHLLEFHYNSKLFFFLV